MFLQAMLEKFRKDYLEHAETHIKHLLARGPRLSPGSASKCIVQAAISYLQEKEYFDLYHSAKTDGAAEPALGYECPSDPVLYLFKMGHVYEDILAEIVLSYKEPFRKFGATDLLGREIQLVNSMWSGRVDLVTIEGDGVILWENKSTKGYAISNFALPRTSDSTQLGIYISLWNELFPDVPIKDATIVYWPNDAHPTKAVRQDLIRTCHIQVKNLSVIKNTMQHTEELVANHSTDNYPTPTYSPDAYPCSWKAGKCKYYEICHGQGDSWEEIPF